MNRNLAFVDAMLTKKQMTPAEMRAVEQLGDDALDHIVGLLEQKAVVAQAKINALRLLSILTREFCASRKVEVFEWALRLCDDSSENVRSTAAHTAIVTHEILARRTEAAQDTQERLRQLIDALHKAQMQGLDEQYRDFVKGFLQHSPPASG